MEQWVDIYDAAGTTRLGGGPIITAQDLSRKRKLDGQGRISFKFPATDARALELCQHERQARLYVRDRGETREIGRGIIRSKEYDGGDAKSIRVDGPDSLDALTRYTVGRFRTYEAEEIADIAAELVDLVPGWTVEAEDGLGLQSARFNGANVLKALIRMTEEKGLHLREGTAANTVEIGAFGEQTNLVAANVGGISRALYGNKDLLIIDRLYLKSSTEAIATRIYPLGSGEGTAAITLALSTRTGPYTIQSTVRGGVTEYYIQDDDAVAAYGVIEAYRTFKEITPISNTDTGKIAAANALYDAAAAWLARNSIEVTNYSFSAKKPGSTIRPGDKIRVQYTGAVYRDNVMVQPAAIDDWFWVMSVEERVAGNGLTVNLEVSNIDQIVKDIEQKIADTIESIEVANVAIKTFPIWTTHYDNEMVEYVSSSLGQEATFYYELDGAITDATSIVLRFTTKPLSTPVRVQTLFDIAGNNLGYVFNAVQGDQHPKGLRVLINGVDYTTQFGGPWNPLSTDNNVIDVSQDIIDILKADGFYQRHTITFRATTPGTGTYPVPLHNVGTLNGQRSSGFIKLSIRVAGNVQAII